MTENYKFSLPPFTVEEIPFGIQATGAPTWGLQKMNALSQWTKTQGEGVVIAVFDTGVNKNHETLAGQIIDGKNFTIEYSANPTIYDDNNGHGTHVCGTIAGIPNNTHTIGIAPQSKIIMGKVATASGGVDSWLVIDAINWAVDWRGPNGEKVDIISMSLTTSNVGLMYEAFKRARDAGIIIVGAAGNSGDGNPVTNEYSYLQSQNDTVSVANMTEQEYISSSSSSNSFIDVCAPGTSVISADYNGISSYVAMTGTSMATPHIAGALALILSAYKKAGRTLTSTEAVKILKKTTRKVAYSSGEKYDRNQMGYGLVDFSVKSLPKANSLNALETNEVLPYIHPSSITDNLLYIRPQKFWERTHGKGRVIAILTTGIDTTHSAFAGKILGGKNFTTDYTSDINNYTDNHGLGTWVAGLAVGNTKLYTGIAPQAKVIVGKVQKSDGSVVTAEAVAGIDWATNWVGPNGEKVDVILTTYAVPTSTDPSADTFYAVQRAISAGILFVSGAGDTGDGLLTTDEPLIPAVYQNVLSVGATTSKYQNLESQIDSLWNGTSSFGSELSAPGASFMYGLKLNNTIGTYAAPLTANSTHYAAGYVAGALTLFLNVYKQVGIEFKNAQNIVDTNLVWKEFQKFLRPAYYSTGPTPVNTKGMGIGVLDLSYAELPDLQPIEKNIGGIGFTSNVITETDGGKYVNLKPTTIKFR